MATDEVRFYGMQPSLWYQVMFILSTQLIGYTFAGLSRQWLVDPSSMIWPSVLVNCALFQVLHPKANEDTARLDLPSNDIVYGPSRTKFFFILFLVGFVWALFPSFFVPALSYFSIITWFAPKNVVLNTIFGTRSGMGLLPITFDWAQV